MAVATVKLRSFQSQSDAQRTRPRPGPFLYAPPSVGDCVIRLAAGSSVGYLTSVTIGGRIVTLPGDREADSQQAEVFHALLAQRRAELCDLLDDHAIKLVRAERNHDTAGVRRKRRRIKEIGAEIRDIDRMMLGLKARLLARSATVRHPARAVNPSSSATERVEAIDRLGPFRVGLG